MPIDASSPPAIAIDGLTRPVPHTAASRPAPRRSARAIAWSDRAKRLFDVTATGAALIVLSPLFGGVALVLKLSDPGPVLYGHRRVGRGGRSFACLKFRTMATNGDEVLERLLRDDPVAREEWEATRKLRHDPRVTEMGRVLRRTSLDELPQLINILRGDMSVVGPRPVVDDELERYGRSASAYLSVRPGLTGLWQVSGRSDTTYHERVMLDRHYAARRSMGMDLAIIARTIPAVLRSSGSY